MISRQALGGVLMLGAIGVLVYRQWTRKGTATWGPIESVEGDAPDPFGGTPKPGPIGAPGSDPYADHGSLTGATEQQEWDALNRYRYPQTETAYAGGSATFQENGIYFPPIGVGFF